MKQNLTQYFQGIPVLFICCLLPLYIESFTFFYFCCQSNLAWFHFFRKEKKYNQKKKKTDQNS